MTIQNRQYVNNIRGLNEDFGTSGGWGTHKGPSTPLPAFPINIPGIDDEFYHPDGTGGDWIDDDYWNGPDDNVIKRVLEWLKGLIDGRD